MFNYLTNSILEDVVNGGIFDQFEFDDLDTVTEHDKDNHKPELEIKVFTPEQNKQILEACKGWAGLGYKEKDQTISDYLQEFSETTGIHVSKKQFETALRRAGERGIIIKKKGRWKLP